MNMSLHMTPELCKTLSGRTLFGSQNVDPVENEERSSFITYDNSDVHDIMGSS